jgi:Zn-finger nucleic acid-binding protein
MMIEKLKNIPIDMNGEPSAVWLKINELVDAVNTIQKEREAELFEIQEWIGILEAVRKSVNVHEKQIDKLQTKLEPEKCEKPSDPYAENTQDETPRCPFCGEELSYAQEIDGGFEILTCDCPHGIWLFGNDKMWYTLGKIKEQLPKVATMTKPICKDTTNELLVNVVGLRQQLDRTRKALDVAVDALDAGKTLADIAGFKMLVAGLEKALEQIKALEQKDVK